MGIVNHHISVNRNAANNNNTNRDIQKDIELVMAQTDQTENVARDALARNNGDLVAAIMELLCGPDWQTQPEYNDPKYSNKKSFYHNLYPSPMREWNFQECEVRAAFDKIKNL